MGASSAFLFLLLGLLLPNLRGASGQGFEYGETIDVRPNKTRGITVDIRGTGGGGGATRNVCMHVH